MSSRILIALLAAVALAAAAVFFWQGRAGSPVAAQRADDRPSAADPARRVVGGKPERDPAPAARRVVGGRVLGPDGAPVPGAQVALHEVGAAWPKRALRPLDSAFTSDDGRFEFQTEPGTDLLLVVGRDGLARREVAVPAPVSDLTVRMAHGFEVTGFVRNMNGELEPNCDVFLEPGSWSNTPAIRERTDQNGQFRFANVPAGLARVTARHAHYPPASELMVAIGSGERIPLQFSASGMAVTTGRVVEAGATKRPVAGARVEVYPGSWNGGLYEPTVTTTDAAGVFKLRQLGTSNLRFEVHHPHYSVAMRSISPRPGAPIEFELVERVEVVGRLSGANAGSVPLRIETAAGEKARAITAADGSFAFGERLSAGAAMLAIEDGRLAFQHSSNRLLEVTIDETARARLDVEVVPPALVRGRVVDGAGQPVGGVIVSTPRSLVRNEERFAAVTDWGGNFALMGLAPGVAPLEFEREGLVVLESTVTVPAAGQSVDAPEVRLVPTGELTGAVVRGGRPVPGAIVFVGRAQQSRAAITGPDGVFVLRGVAPGEYRVKARYSTLPFVTAEGAFAVRSGESTTVPDLVVPAGRRVAGMVQEADNGRPIADALVFVRGNLGSVTYTDSGGRFQIDVSDEAEALTVYAPDFTAHVDAKIERGGLDVMVPLPSVARSPLRARVLGLPTRKPVTAAVIRITGDRASPDWDESLARQRDVAARAVEMPNGLLMIDWIPAGRSRLVLQCQGFAPYAADVDVPRRDTTDLGTIVLEPGAAVSGVVVDEGGEPIAGADVFLGRDVDMLQPGFRPMLQSDSGGKFAVHGVTPSSRRLVVWSEGFAAASVDLAIPRDLLRSASDPLRVVLRPCSWINVQVQDAGGAPTDTRLVVLATGATVVAQAFPDADGRVAFAARGAGEYEVTLFGEDVSMKFAVGDEPSTQNLVMRSER